MRVGANVFPLRNATGGARHVVAGLFPALLRLDGEHEYVLFTHPGALAAVHEFIRGHEARARVVPVIDEENIYPHRDEFDLYFGPLNNLRPRLYDRPTVAILLDIQEQYFPQYFGASELAARREAYPELCRAATTVVTISQFSRRCIVEKFGIDAGKIEVVPIAPQAGLVTTDPSDSGDWPGEKPVAPFFFCPAHAYPHKNHAMLLDAVERLPVRVVFAGTEPPGGYPLRRQIIRRGLSDRCPAFGDLSPGQMRFLYRRATATVLPTMFEGFGMPAVEAMACGCPLVCSDIPALREIAGDNALYFRAGDMEDLCARLMEISAAADLRARLADGGYAIAAHYTWEASGRRMLDIFAEAPRRFKSFAICDLRFAIGEGVPTPSMPRIGIVVRGMAGSEAVAQTLQSITATGYDNVRVQVAEAREGESLIDAAGADLVMEVLSGNRLRPSALDSLAGSWRAAPASAIHLGEAATWNGAAYAGVARLQLTGDGLWKLQGLLYPEMVAIAPAAMASWNAGLKLLHERGPDWRWKLIGAARRDGQLAMARRTLADCDPRSLGRWPRLRAWRSGMFRFYRDSDGRPARVGLLRHFERSARRASQFLPTPLQHLGTRIWYRVAR